MSQKHTKAVILEGALAAALDDGLSQLTFGRLAKRLGMSTRTLIRWEQSTKDIPPILLAAVSLLTDVNLGWLQTGVANQSDGSLEDVSVSMIEVRPEGFEPPTFWFGADSYTLAA